jgi:uncharacterized membrane protein YvbJ
MKIKCPYCAEEIEGEAKKCKHCGEWMSKKLEQQLGAAPREPFGLPKSVAMVVVIFSLLIVGSIAWEILDIFMRHYGR